MLEFNQIKDNIRAIEEEIISCDHKVTLLCATKTIAADIINKLSDLGITDIGENRVQELKDKYQLVTSKFNWHFIGALQTNKVKYIIDKVTMIHSVDRLELADEINNRCLKNGITMKVLAEVNIGKEKNKSGTEVENLKELLDYISEKENLKLCGLMTVMPIGAKENLYAEMQKLYEDNKRAYGFNTLSMGMSGDYKTALKYGSTLIRIGRGIFGEREYK